MNYERACELLRLDADEEHDVINIKKNYKRMALLHHPDKNSAPDASKTFQEIHEAYEFLMKWENYMDEDDLDNEFEEENINIDKTSYRWTVFSFLKNILQTENANKLIYMIIQKISTTCELTALDTLEKIDKTTLIKIYDILKMYKGAFHFTDDFVSKIGDMVKEKCKTDECVILNPTIDDLFENNLYKIHINNFTYIVPLWHHELVYDNSGSDVYVKCNPILEDHIHIDNKNNVHVELKYTVQELWSLEHVDFRIGKSIFSFDPRFLKLRSQQTLVLSRMGIPKINTEQVYDVEKKADIYLQIQLTADT